MAKKLIQLSTIDIILQADAETIREAYESRVEIDELLVKRMEAYEQIEQLEQQIETLVGEEGAFAYPAPALPVAGFSKLVATPRPAAPKPAPAEEPAETEDSLPDVDDAETDSEEETD